MSKPVSSSWAMAGSQIDQIGDVTHSTGFFTVKQHLGMLHVSVPWAGLTIRHKETQHKSMWTRYLTKIHKSSPASGIPGIPSSEASNSTGELDEISYHSVCECQSAQHNGLNGQGNMTSHPLWSFHSPNSIQGYPKHVLWLHIFRICHLQQLPNNQRPLPSASMWSFGLTHRKSTKITKPIRDPSKEWKYAIDMKLWPVSHRR